MEENELAERLAAPMAKNYLMDLVVLAENDELSVAAAHRLCYTTGRGRVAFRAAWILEYIAIHCPEKFLLIFDDFIQRLPEQQNFSCQRHFTKILMEITGPNLHRCYREAYARVDKEQLVSTAFEWLINPATPVAVQANCMDVLFNLTADFGWIRVELRDQIEFLLRDGSAALQSRGKKILHQLRKLKSAG